MSTSTINLVNETGYCVRIPDERAHRLFGIVRRANALAQMAPGDDAEDDVDSQSANSGAENEDHTDGAGSCEDSDGVVLNQLQYDDVVLDALMEYAMLPDEQRTANIPRPLVGPIEQCVFAHELEYLRRAEAGQFLVPLLDLAFYLRFDQLMSLCGAYMSVRIDEISRAAPDIMTGAASVRQFLMQENEWTEEEMEHLSKEMAYAKQVDPNVY